MKNLYIYSIIINVGSTKKKTNTQMVNNHELHTNINLCRDEVNSLNFLIHCLANVERRSKKLWGKINIIEETQNALGSN